jgi:hypothetical protein
MFLMKYDADVNVFTGEITGMCDCERCEFMIAIKEDTYEFEGRRFLTPEKLNELYSWLAEYGDELGYTNIPKSFLG